MRRISAYCLAVLLSGALLVPVQAASDSVRRIDIPPWLRVKAAFLMDSHSGVIHSQIELQRFWSKLYSTQDPRTMKTGVHGAGKPKVDFNKELVLWYSGVGPHACAVRSIAISEEQGKLLARVGICNSLFGTANLTVWSIPKTDKPVEIRAFVACGS